MTRNIRLSVGQHTFNLQRRVQLPYVSPLNIAMSSNGRTTAFEVVNVGSIPTIALPTIITCPYEILSISKMKYIL